MRVALYVRVSTKRQKHENQQPKLEKFAKDMRWTVVARYVDHDSGGKADRPAFKKMFDAASRREFATFRMDLRTFWPRASRVGYRHRWPFSLRIVNKAVSRTQSLARSMPERKCVGTNQNA